MGKMKNTRKNQLPWFDLRKYEKTKELDAQGWHQQLTFRHYLQYLIIENADMTLANSLMEEIKSQGIVTKYKNQSFIPPKHLPISTVRSLTRAEAYMFSSILELDVDEKKRNEEFGFDLNSFKQLKAQAKYPKEYEDFNSSPFDIYIRTVKLKSNPYSNPYNTNDLVHVTVDLLASDKQLKDDFESWLSAFRKKIANTQAAEPKSKITTGMKIIAEGKFNTGILEKWVKYKLLAYIDLTLWIQLKQIPMSADEIVYKLYPEDKTVTRTRVDELLKPLVKSLMNLEVLHKLYLYSRKH